MWSFLVAITAAAAVGWAAGCCIAAIMMQTKSNTMQPKPDLVIEEMFNQLVSMVEEAKSEAELAQEALTTATLEAVPMRRHDTRKAAARQAVPVSIGMQLRRRYDDVANEPIPAHLTVLVQRLENLATV